MVKLRQQEKYKENCCWFLLLGKCPSGPSGLVPAPVPSSALALDSGGGSGHADILGIGGVGVRVGRGYLDDIGQGMGSQ